MMACKEDISIVIPEQYSSSTSSSYPSPPTVMSSNHSEPSDPPTHRLILPLDRVGVSQEPIGPKRRSRRGCQPRTPQQQARSVARRNARERKRVRLVNLGFATLRDHIPPHLGVATTPSSTGKNRGSDASNKKLSKVETLRCAIEYIKQLQEAIGYDDKDSVGASVEDFSSSPQLDNSSSPSYCTSPSPVMMLMDSAVHHSPMFEDDENDDFFNIVDWTSL